MDLNSQVCDVMLTNCIVSPVVLRTNSTTHSFPSPSPMMSQTGNPVSLYYWTKM